MYAELCKRIGEVVIGFVGATIVFNVVDKVVDEVKRHLEEREAMKAEVTFKVAEQ